MNKSSTRVKPTILCIVIFLFSLFIGKYNHPNNRNIDDEETKSPRKV
jgi:hypothetical protein